MELVGAVPRMIDDVLSAAEGPAMLLPEPVSRGIDFARSLLKEGDASTSVVDISPEYRDLINKQIETQMELQQVSLVSNIERSKHEARMAAVRNIRVS